VIVGFPLAGNWTRWFNHTCFNPNVNAITVKTVFDWSRGEVIPLVGFVAIRDSASLLSPISPQIFSHEVGRCCCWDYSVLG
jgi:hypothetical protein